MLDWELGRLKSSTFLKGICVVGLWKLLTEAAEMVRECGPRTMPEACHLSCVSHFTCLCPHPCSLNLSGARFFPPLKADSQGRWREQVQTELLLRLSSTALATCYFLSDPSGRCSRTLVAPGPSQNSVLRMGAACQQLPSTPHPRWLILAVLKESFLWYC